MSVREHRQAAIALELLAEILPNVRDDRNLPARIQHRLVSDRRFGSRDRRLYRELLYTAIRHLPWFEQSLLDATRPHAGRQAATVSLLARLATRTPHTADFLDVHAPADPPPLPPLETVLPDWFRRHTALPDAELRTLHTRAPLWIRLNTSEPTTLLRMELAAQHAALEPSGVLPGAFRVSPDTRLAGGPSHLNGDFEIQDLGSQLILARQPGEIFNGLWLDACAGAGGKTLQLARLLPRGSIVHAHDIRRSALEELGHRARRSRAPNIRVLAPDSLESLPARAYDGILVDAPCTGLGTLRRSPHLKWTTTPVAIRDAAEAQLAILNAAVPKLKPGGHLIYATCSVTREENEGVVGRFLEQNPGFATVCQRAILPSEHDTDAYFTATFRLRMERLGG